MIYSLMLKRYPLLSFYVLCFALTWSVWLPAAAGTYGLLPFRVPIAIDGAAYFLGPPLAAGIVLYADQGSAGIRALLGRLLLWRVGAQWYAVALLWRPAVSATALALMAALGAPTAPLNGPWYIIAPLFVLTALARVVLYVGEEIGWRGYALPRLQARLGPLAASMLIGLLAGVWHLPAFFIAGHPQYGTPIAPFIIWMIALAIVFTWLYNHTHGSLLPVALLHGAINSTDVIFPGVPLLLEVGITLMAAIVLALIDRPALGGRRRTLIYDSGTGL
jgi:membrane protease YdiL (CAAX protease family)